MCDPGHLYKITKKYKNIHGTNGRSSLIETKKLTNRGGCEFRVAFLSSSSTVRLQSGHSHNGACKVTTNTH